MCGSRRQFYSGSCGLADALPWAGYCVTCAMTYLLDRRRKKQPRATKNQYVGVDCRRGRPHASLRTFGDTCVYIAVRMAELALAGQTLTHASTVAAPSTQLRDATRPINALPVKGGEEEVEMHELIWQQCDDPR